MNKQHEPLSIAGPMTPRKLEDISLSDPFKINMRILWLECRLSTMDTHRTLFEYPYYKRGEEYTDSMHEAAKQKIRDEIADLRELPDFEPCGYP